MWFLSYTNVQSNINFYHQDKSNWYWVASAKMVASVSVPSNLVSQSLAVSAVKGHTENVLGDLEGMRKAANYFVDGNINSTHFEGYGGQIYSEALIRRFIKWNKPIIVSLQRRNTSEGHAIVLKGYAWSDAQGMANSPGFYYYYFADPDEYNMSNLPLAYDDFVGWNLLFDNEMRWIDSVVYKTSYSNQTIVV